MNLILVDDELLALAALEEAVTEALPGAQYASFDRASTAIEYARENPVDVAFLDINMRAMSGLEMALELQNYHPDVNIIFCTGYEEYALDAIRLHCSEYLVKPISSEKVADAMQHLRHPVAPEKRVRMHCFGNFEVYCDGKPVIFTFNRTKEMLAYLVDRDGVDVSTREIMAAVFEDSISRPYFSQLRNDLIHTFEKLEISNCLRISRSLMAIERDEVDCDYFDYLDGKLKNQPVEYMTQYSFSEVTLSGLLSME
ncbi:MAG: response regulator [Lachnospiraceae bacterium]|nr:response regulator [Lachnospiraceae bacterium]